MIRTPWLLFLLLPTLLRAEEYHGPWDMKSLQQAPKVEWIDQTGPLRQLYYEGEPLGGKSTRVFAYLALPEKAEGKVPAMVLVHGGGGTAFREWAELWAKRGYAALAMDLAGCGPERKRLPDGMPDQNDKNKLPLEPKPLKEIWTYHAVAAVIRGVSLLSNLPEVDANKIGITGISWGGYLTCIVMGLDHRLKVAVPVYGCGFIYHNSVWVPTFEKMKSDWRKEWVRNFDPSKYAGQAKMPVLFVNGTNDFAYPLDSYQKTYRLVKNRTLCIKVNMPHGHKEGWAPVEIGLFVDRYLKGGKPFLEIPNLPRIGENNGKVLLSLDFANGLGIGAAEVKVHWTTELDQPWQKRKWQSRDCISLAGDVVDHRLAELPRGKLIAFVTVTDNRGATVSTEHMLVEK